MKKVDTKKARLAINFSEEFEDVYCVKLNNDGLLKIYDMTIQFKKETIEEAFLILLRRYDDAKEAFTKWGGVCYNLEKEYFEELADDDLIDNTSKDLAKGFQYKPFLLEKWHIDHITSVRISPDGKTIISASRDGNIKLWDIQSAECIDTLSGHEGFIHSVAISLDGKTIVSLGGDCTIKIWDMQSAECIDTIIDPNLSGAISNQHPVVVSSDGKTIVFGSYNMLKIWDLRSGECIKKEHTGFVNTIVISPDGKTLVAISTRATSIWDMQSGECINTLEEGSCAAISPDSKTIFFGCSNAVKIWDIGNGEYIATLEGHTYSVNSIVVSSDGKTIVSQESGKLKIWDVTSAECINTLDDPQEDVWELISVEGKTIVAYCLAHMSYVDIMDIYNGDRMNTLFLQRYKTPVESVAVSPDGKTIVSGGLDNPIKIWDIQSGKCLDTVEGHRHLEETSMSEYSIAISPDGKTIVSIGTDREIKLWDMQSGECIDTLELDIEDIEPVAISPDSKTIVSLCYNEVMIWDARSGECINTWQHHIEYDNMRGLVAISSDGKTIIYKAAWNELKIWDVINNEDIEYINTLAGHTREITSVVISPDGRTIVSGDKNHTIKIWNIKTGECTDTIKVHAHKIRSVAISSDGKTIVSGDMNNTIKIWDIKTGECICTIDHDYKASIDKNGYFIGSVEAIDKYIRISEKPLSQRKLTPSEIKHFKRNRFLDL